jgi:polar amino acid transport system substrate-binding protein
MRDCLLAAARFWSSGVLLVALAVPVQAQNASVELVTGDYPPFSSEDAPAMGVLSEVVVAAFKEQGVAAQLRFMPWQRGYMETRNGLHTATFPYVKNEERQRDFWFSQPLYPDVVRLFVLPDVDAAQDWAGKSICVPQGYNMARVAPFIENQQARVERPPDMLNCFQMLQRGRVQAVWSSETVAEFVTRDLRREGLRFKPLTLGLEYPVELYLIISRQLPQAQQWLERFNVGLAKIQKNGSYAKILLRHKMQIK